MGAPAARKGPTGALGVALRQTVKGESMADDRESRFEAAGCGGGLLMLCRSRSIARSMRLLR